MPAATPLGNVSPILTCIECAIAQDMQAMLKRCLRQPLRGTHYPSLYTNTVRAIASPFLLTNLVTSTIRQLD
ncbi:MAG: hypothetical protein RMY34_16415 [Aulosira sp. DedQUE10]|nr:hypothetical protein [Aulosira sp. DedQUE10]